ncbi:MAG: DUF5688 family protein [Lachnospiraceae bacterium]|nr:DUF5688 family protein [Lachnospiraceae bacterium]
MGIQVCFKEGGCAYLTQPDYEGFRREVMDKLRDICGEEFDVHEVKALKNNGLELYGVAILAEGSRISPTIYLEGFYEEYCKGNMTIDEAVNGVLRIYSANARMESPDVQSFGNFDYMSDKLVCQLVNYEKNRELLESLPHRRYLDFALIYCVFLGNTGQGIGTITVRNEHIRAWNVCEEELYRIAFQNTIRIFKPVVHDFGDIVSKIIEKEGCELSSDNLLEGDLLNVGKGESEFGPGASPMYVLTNEQGYRGASCILYQDLLKDISARLDTDLFLLPSSIHEFILIPFRSDIEPSELEELVTSVNRTAVGVEDYLSDHVYRYFRDRDQICQL